MINTARFSGLLLAFLGFCATPAVPAFAEQIVGITFYDTLYSVDPLTGNTALLDNTCGGAPCGPYFGASASPDFGNIYVDSVVNVHEFNVNTFQDTLVGGIPIGVDLAFSQDSNTLYTTSGSALYSVQCPSPPNLCTETQIGPVFPTSHMQALDFVSGAGLYGVGDNNLYLINPTSGIATLIGFTGIEPDPLGNTNVTDLAYDDASGRFIASVGCLKQVGPLGTGGPCDPSIPGSIYWIDPSTGHGTLLNDDAPQLMGLAEVPTPESPSKLPVAAGLGALMVWSWRRKLFVD